MIQSTSLQAYLSILPDLPRRESECFKVVVDAGDYGVTNSELAVALGDPKALNRFSGRLTSLKQKGWVVPNGKKRNGQTVLVRGNGIPLKKKKKKSFAKGVVLDRENKDGELIVKVRIKDRNVFLPNGSEVKMEYFKVF